MAYLYLALAFCLNAAANILLKLGSARGIALNGHVSLTALLSNWQLCLGVILFAVNILFYFLALRALPLSVAYPIMIAGSFIIVNSFAFFQLREAIGVGEIVGYLMILAGLVLVAARA